MSRPLSVTNFNNQISHTNQVNAAEVAGFLFNVFGNGQLSTVSDPGFNFGTGDFTVELTLSPANNQITIVDFRDNTGQDRLRVDLGANNNITVYNGETLLLTSTNPVNAFYEDIAPHVAVTRESGVIKIWIEGALQGSVANTTNFTQGPISVAASYNRSTQYDGTFGEVRVSTVARYTSAFTQPTTMHVDDSDTSLLLHSDGPNNSTSIVDDASNQAPTGTRSAAAATFNNNAIVSTAQSKFGSSSVYLDGVDNTSITVASYDQTATSNEFTLDTWVRFPVQPSAMANGFAVWFITVGDTAGRMFSTVSSDPGAGAGLAVDAAGERIRWSWNPALDQWYHMVLTRDSSNVLHLYIDGVEPTVMSGNTTYTGNFFTGDLRFGQWNSGFYAPSEFYLDEFRLSSVNRYPANFTSPTSAFVNDTDTAFLFDAEGANNSTSIDDDTSIPPSYTQGEASLTSTFTLTADLTQQVEGVLRSDTLSSLVKLIVPFDARTNEFKDYGADGIIPTSGSSSSISNAVTKWVSPDYGGSYLGSRTGQALRYTLPSALPSAATGTYVMELWVKAGNSQTNANWTLGNADVNGRWLFGFHNGTTFRFGGENWVGLGTQWTHVAIVCDAGSKRFYINGMYKGVWGSGNTGFSTLHVGHQNPGDSNDFIGNLQDLRVTVGHVRGYAGTSTSTANFTLPNSLIESFQATQVVAEQGEAALTTSSTLSATVDRVRGTNIDLTTSSTLSATVGKVVSANITLTAVFSSSTTVNATKNGEISLTVVSTLAAIAARIRTVDVSLLNIVTLNIQAAKTVDVASNLDSSFNLSVTPARLRSTPVSLTSNTTLDATPLRIREFSADLSVSFALLAASNKVTDTSATLNCNATVTAQAGRIRSGDAQFNSAFTLVAAAQAIRGSSASLEVSSTLTTIVNKIVGFSANLNTNTLLEASANYTTNANAQLAMDSSLTANTTGVTLSGPIDLVASSSITAVINVKRNASAALESSTSLIASVLSVQSAQASLTTVTSLDAQAQRLRTTAVTLTSSFGVTVAVKGLVRASADLTLTSTLTATPNVLRRLTATLNCNATVTATAGRIRSSNAQFNSEFTLTANARTLVFDDIVYVIAKENRSVSIVNENRSWEISNE